MYDQILHTIVRGRYRSEAAVLNCWQRFLVKDELYPAIVRGEGAVKGILLHDVAGFDMGKLDLFEGEYYQRVLVTVNVGEVEYEAFVYAIVDEFKHLVTDLPWCDIKFVNDDFHTFLKQYSGWNSI